MPRLLIGNIKGTKGDTGATGAQGAAGTIEIGTVQTVSYGSPASVTNSGTDTEAVLDFQIPQGAPGETVSDMSNLTLQTITDSTADYPTFAVGETGASIFGKIRKFLSDLKSKYVSKSMMTTSTNVGTAGQYVADAQSIKSLNDALQNSIIHMTSTKVINFRDYTWTRSGSGMYYMYIEPTDLYPNITFNNIFSIEIINFASLRETDVFIPFVRNGAYVGFMSNVNTWFANNSGVTIKLIYN